MHEKLSAPKPQHIKMKGFLTFRILCFLLDNPLDGQQIAKLIQKMSGKKPSPGTIYPVLKDLKSKGLITTTRRGKSIVYQLSMKGKKEAGVACKYFYDTFHDVIKRERK